MDFFKRHFKTICIYLIIIFVIVLLLLFFGKKDYDDSAIALNHIVGEETIVIGNGLPMTDEMGKKLSISNFKKGTNGYIEFEVKSLVNDRIKYEIYIKKDNHEVEIPLKYVKVYLVDEDNNELEYFDGSRVPTYYDLRLAEKNPSGKLLYSGSLKKNESKKFKLRMWVADTYELTPEEVNFSVKLDVSVK